ncbi:hypothetical protein QTO34_010878 [Cnephaeus nilssonii]|uniref:Katanin p80 WD40 repeat-containing subunit B1 n=1 Tax=Cnephaeus nilssonii TaxID=3371016 RepID=A0AA40HGC9_CNENI|nr:hypothetical protein QTO34_010878 [Eptesicus nilssonii]
MATPVVTKTAWKLLEIVAHASNVSSLVLGKGSGRLLATGGDDCRVNLWSINKPNCIMSLTGHTSPVESVRLNTPEELIVAGSQSGSIRVWDLEAAKILRTLVGHKANICSLDFHPYGEFVASGSQDTNIKLWDVRRKGCVFRYRGHSQAVRCLRFSPDGKWLASAADDHTVKLWDLTAGKMMSEFPGHTGPVNVVEFHPNEYLLASGSSDRTIRFWDLEKFQVVSCIEGEPGPVRSILFNPDGCCLYSGCQDSLRVYGWEPERCFDVVLVNWGKVADLAICNNQLIGVAFSQSNVSSYVVDLTRVTRTGTVAQDPVQDSRLLTQQPPLPTAPLRRIYERPSTTCSKPQRVKQNSESERRSPSSEDDRDERESRARSRTRGLQRDLPAQEQHHSRCQTSRSHPGPRPRHHGRPGRGPQERADREAPAEQLILQRFLPLITDILAAPPSVAQEHQRPRQEQAVWPAGGSRMLGERASPALPAHVSPSRRELVNAEHLESCRRGPPTISAALTSRAPSHNTARATWTLSSSKDTGFPLCSRWMMESSSGSKGVCNMVWVAVCLLDGPMRKQTLTKLALMPTMLAMVPVLLQSSHSSQSQGSRTELRLDSPRPLKELSDTQAPPGTIIMPISQEEKLRKQMGVYERNKQREGVERAHRPGSEDVTAFMTLTV